MTKIVAAKTGSAPWNHAGSERGSARDVGEICDRRRPITKQFEEIQHA
jgi:hypothetical protein